MFFFHTHTHARCCEKKKIQQNIFFVPLFIYILEDLKLIVFIFTLTFDKTDFFFSSAFEFRFRESETNLNLQAFIFSIWSVEIYLLNYLPPFF